MPTSDRYSQSRNQLLDQMAYAMGGRTAEEIVFHNPTTGASNDIEKATNIARTMVIEYGFSDKLGAIKWGDDDDQTTVMDGLQPRKYSDRTAEVIDDEVLKLVETAHTEAWTIINENRDILDELVRQLLVKETLNEKELAGSSHRSRRLRSVRCGCPTNTAPTPISLRWRFPIASSARLAWARKSKCNGELARPVISQIGPTSLLHIKQGGEDE